MRSSPSFLLVLLLCLSFSSLYLNLASSLLLMILHRLLVLFLFWLLVVGAVTSRRAWATPSSLRVSRSDHIGRVCSVYLLLFLFILSIQLYLHCSYFWLAFSFRHSALILSFFCIRISDSCSFLASSAFLVFLCLLTVSLPGRSCMVQSVTSRTSFRMETAQSIAVTPSCTDLFFPVLIDFLLSISSTPSSPVGSFSRL